MLALVAACLQHANMPIFSNYAAQGCKNAKANTVKDFAVQTIPVT